MLTKTRLRLLRERILEQSPTTRLFIDGCARCGMTTDPGNGWCDECLLIVSAGMHAIPKLEKQRVLRNLRPFGGINGSAINRPKNYLMTDETWDLAVKLFEGQ